MFLAFFSWWYTSGWVGCFRRWLDRYKSLSEYFSISTLLSTLFNPFRQNTYMAANKSLDAKFHTMLENLFSRSIGFVVRVILIFTATIVLILTAPLMIAELIIWPFVPFMWLIIPMIAITFGGLQ